MKTVLGRAGSPPGEEAQHGIRCGDRWEQSGCGCRRPAYNAPLLGATEAGRDLRELVSWALCHLSVSISEGSCRLLVLDGIEGNGLEAEFA